MATYNRNELVGRINALTVKVNSEGKNQYLGTTKENAKKRLRYYQYLLKRLGTRNSFDFPESEINELKKKAGSPSF